MRNVQTAVSPHPLKIGHMFIRTYLLGIVHGCEDGNGPSFRNIMFSFYIFKLWFVDEVQNLTGF